MNLKKWSWIGAAFLLLVAALFLFFKTSPPPPKKLPNPNGYDDLVKAAGMFIGDLPECFWSQSLEGECVEATKGYLNTNSEALKLARVGLSREGRIPIVFTKAYFIQHIPELALMKRLAQTLNAEGKVAEKDNRTNDAIQNYVDAALIHDKMRGGVMIDALVGIACEAIGVGSLRKLADQMTMSQRKNLIEKLSRMHANRDPLDEILWREKQFVKVYGPKEQLTYFVMFRSRRILERSLERKLKYAHTRLGLFLVDLSLRNFESENKVSPKTLQELVPKYIPFLPKDDFSGNDFIYRPSTNGYEIYSVGPDGKDDGGKPFLKRGTDSPGDMLPNAQY